MPPNFNCEKPVGVEGQSYGKMYLHYFKNYSNYNESRWLFTKVRNVEREREGKLERYKNDHKELLCVSSTMLKQRGIYKQS